jgi:L-ascorbate metabolism protein UlaG (beta-lactamase superfamily)
MEEDRSMLNRFLLVALLAACGAGLVAASEFEKDVIQTSRGALEITFIGHGSVGFAIGGKVIYVDPVSREADYGRLPKADVVLVTHSHGDHLDPKALEACRKPESVVIVAADCAGKVDGGLVLRNGGETVVGDLALRAVPAYNILHERSPGVPFHAKGQGNGYILTFGDTQVYVAGDTENIPEMRTLEGIDVAFLPMNVPYTMTPEMVADAARAFGPRILYPYHYGDTDPALLVKLLAGEKRIDVRVRSMR